LHPRARQNRPRRLVKRFLIIRKPTGVRRSRDPSTAANAGSVATAENVANARTDKAMDTASQAGRTATVRAMSNIIAVVVRATAGAVADAVVVAAVRAVGVARVVAAMATRMPRASASAKTTLTIIRGASR
jgi:hypothetical protein